MNPMTPFWDGELPFEQRQTIEDYQTDVEPLVEQVVTRLEALGAGEISVAGPSELQGCDGPDHNGYEVDGASLRGGPVDVDAAKREIDAVLSPAGFSTTTDHRAKTANFSWYDTDDGGYFDLIVVAGSHTAFSYGSGCRPTDGTTTDRHRDRVTPAWESALPPFTAPSQSGQ